MSYRRNALRCLSRCWALGLVVLVAGLAGAAEAELGAGSAPPRRLDPEVGVATVAEAQLKVGRWLQCDRCAQGEFSEVVALGADAVPPLEAAVLGGPSNGSVEMLRRHLVSQFFVLSRSAGASTQESGETAASAPISMQNFLARYLRAQSLRVRLRAVQALVALEGDASRKALLRLSRTDLADLPEEVLDALAEANAQR